MRKSKYLVLSGLYFKFSEDLLKIIEVKKLFNTQNILDILKFYELSIINNFEFNQNKINFAYLNDNIQKTGMYSFSENYIKYVNFSNSKLLNTINEKAFGVNQIQHLILPDNIQEIKEHAFEKNNIKYINLLKSKYTTLKIIYEDSFSDNPLQTIIISEQITLYYDSEYAKYNKKDPWNKFVNYYNTTGQLAGNYKYKNNQWKWYPL